MKQFVQEILDTYFIKMRPPELSELSELQHQSPLSEKGAGFVTLYKKGEVCGSAGNIKEIHETFAQDLLENTIHALTQDKRFSPPSFDQKDDIHFRVDYISKRDMIDFQDLKKIDPTQHGVIAIKRDYTKLASILPNISPKLLMGADLLVVLQNKLKDSKIDDKNYIFYKIETQREHS